MALHAKMSCYSTLTTPLSILDDLGVVWFAACVAPCTPWCSMSEPSERGAAGPPVVCANWADALIPLPSMG